MNLYIYSTHKIHCTVISIYCTYKTHATNYFVLYMKLLLVSYAVIVLQLCGYVITSGGSMKIRILLAATG